MYSCAGFVDATGAADPPRPAAILWNPSSTRSLHIVRSSVAWFRAGSASGADFFLARQSSELAWNSQITVAQQNDSTYDAAPPSGARLDLGMGAGFSTGLVSAASMFSSGYHSGSGNIGSGWDVPFTEPVRVGPGTGFGWWMRTASHVASFSITFWWIE